MITISNDQLITVMQGVIDNFLIPKFLELGMNATGSWISSLEARAEDGQGQIWGKDYTYYLVNGRAPGNRPPIQPLVNWVGAKFGLSGQQATSAAFAIANKIAAEGTDYYPEGTDLLEVLNSPEVLNYVYNEMGIYMNAQVELEIKRQLNTVFA